MRIAAILSQFSSSWEELNSRLDLKCNQGFTLPEVSLAVVLLLILALPLVNWFDYHQRRQVDDMLQEKAIMVLQRIHEECRSGKYDFLVQSVYAGQEVEIELHGYSTKWSRSDYSSDLELAEYLYFYNISLSWIDLSGKVNSFAMQILQVK